MDHEFNYIKHRKYYTKTVLNEQIQEIKHETSFTRQIVGSITTTRPPPPPFIKVETISSQE